jgi:hypothetical protein
MRPLHQAKKYRPRRPYASAARKTIANGFRASSRCAESLGIACGDQGRQSRDREISFPRISISPPGKFSFGATANLKPKTKIPPGLLSGG